MISSPFVEFPEPARVTPGEAKRGARLPRPKLCIYGGSEEIFSSHSANKISTGNRNPQVDAIEAEEQVAAGRRESPEAVTGQKAGYQTADALWTKAPIHSRRRKFANIAG
jgi:hypothetical protein